MLLKRHLLCMWTCRSVGSLSSDSSFLLRSVPSSWQLIGHVNLAFQFNLLHPFLFLCRTQGHRIGEARRVNIPAFLIRSSGKIFSALKLDYRQRKPKATGLSILLQEEGRSDNKPRTTSEGRCYISEFVSQQSNHSPARPHQPPRVQYCPCTSSAFTPAP
jgi:hypothetical protein